MSVHVEAYAPESQRSDDRQAPALEVVGTEPVQFFQRRRNLSPNPMSEYGIGCRVSRLTPAQPCGAPVRCLMTFFDVETEVDAGCLGEILWLVSPNAPQQPHSLLGAVRVGRDTAML